MLFNNILVLIHNFQNTANSLFLKEQCTCFAIPNEYHFSNKSNNHTNIGENMEFCFRLFPIKKNPLQFCPKITFSMQQGKCIHIICHMYM